MVFQSLTTLMPVDPQKEKGTFLSFLSPANQDDYISRVTSIYPSDPKLYWIFKNIDYTYWDEADDAQVLWLLGPSDRGMTEVLSYKINLEKKGGSQPRSSMFYFLFSALGKGASATKTFIHSFLCYILSNSEDDQAKDIVATFLRSLLLQKLCKNSSSFGELDSLDATVTLKSILDTSSSGLLEALVTIVNNIKVMRETSIIIDGIDKIGPEGAFFLTKFCSQMIKASPKFKALLTSLPNSDVKEKIDGLPCIEYDKERKGIGTLYSLVFGLANLLL